MTAYTTNFLTNASQILIYFINMKDISFADTDKISDMRGSMILIVGSVTKPRN